MTVVAEWVILEFPEVGLYGIGSASSVTTLFRAYVTKLALGETFLGQLLFSNNFILGAHLRRRSTSLSPENLSFSSKDSLNSNNRSSYWKLELANAELENFQMDPQKLKEIKMLRRASRASNTEHLMRQNSQNQSFTSDELQKTSTRELLRGDSHSKSGF